jgi:hypothetical protein
MEEAFSDSWRERKNSFFTSKLGEFRSYLGNAYCYIDGYYRILVAHLWKKRKSLSVPGVVSPEWLLKKENKHTH